MLTTCEELLFSAQKMYQESIGEQMKNLTDKQIQ